MATVESPWDSQQPPRKSPLYLRILGVIFNILLNMVGYTALGVLFLWLVSFGIYACTLIGAFMPIKV